MGGFTTAFSGAIIIVHLFTNCFVSLRGLPRQVYRGTVGSGEPGNGADVGRQSICLWGQDAAACRDMRGFEMKNWLIASALVLAAGAFALSPAVNADPIHDAAKAGDVERMETLLAADAKLANAIDTSASSPYVVIGNAWTPLHWAAYEGRAGAVTLLLEKGAKVGERDSFGFTPLHYAKNAQIVKLLADKGADVDVNVCCNGWTPLHNAAFTNKLDVAKALLAAGAKLEVVDKLGKTPLHYAAGWADEALTKVLLDAKAETGRRDHSGWTPMHQAAFAGKVGQIRLLAQQGARVDVEDYFGRTPMDEARKAGHPEAIEALRSAGARS